MTQAGLPRVAELLARHGVDQASEAPFPNDGWSGATLTRLTGGGRTWILKRDSVAADWIARATADGPLLREAWFAERGPELPPPVRNPAVGGAFDPETGESAILMPDLAEVLFDWDTALSVDRLDAVVAALATLHAHP